MTPHPVHVHVVTSIEEEASGPSYSVVRMAEAQAARGLSSGIYSLSDRPGESCQEGTFYRSFGRSFTALSGLSRLEFSQGLLQSVDEAAKQGSLLHVHGLWRMPNVYPGRAARRYASPLVLSPRGMLSEAALTYSSRQKKIFWHAAQAAALRAVTCYHATSEAELDDIRAFGLSAPVAIIPNGIDVPDTATEQPRQKEVLHLGRLHPKKGIDRLLHAWAAICHDYPDWRLRIVGPSEDGHIEELQRLAEALSLGNSVCFDGPVFGNEKHAAYRRASLFVLPTRNENFGMVVAEALAQGTPVISTVGAPWEGLIRERCGWWVRHGSESLAEAMRDALQTSPRDLERMGTRGREWMARDFGWAEIAERTAHLYAWCRGEADRPEFVHT